MISKYSRSDFLETLFGVYYQIHRGFILVNRVRRGDERTSARYYPKVDILAKEHFGAEQNIYFSVCPRERMKPEKKHIRYAVALWAKVYIGEEGNKGRPYFASPQEAAKTIRRFPKPPTVIVESGTGAHLYWVFDTPFELKDIGRFEKALKHVGSLLRGETELGADAMLRLPETINTMIDERYLQCEVKFINSNFRYRIEELESISAKEMEESMAAPKKSPSAAPPPPQPHAEAPKSSEQAEKSRPHQGESADTLANFNLDSPTEVAGEALNSEADLRQSAPVQTMWFDSSDVGATVDEDNNDLSEELIDGDVDSDDSEPELDFGAGPPERPSAAWAPKEEGEIAPFGANSESETHEESPGIDTGESPLIDDESGDSEQMSPSEAMIGETLTEGIDLDDSMIDELIDDISMSEEYDLGQAAESPEAPKTEEPEEPQADITPEPQLKAPEPEPQKRESHEVESGGIIPKEKQVFDQKSHDDTPVAETSGRETHEPASRATLVNIPSLEELSRRSANIRIEPVNQGKPIEGKLVSVGDRAVCVESKDELLYTPWSNIAAIKTKEFGDESGDRVIDAIGIKFNDKLIEMIPAGVVLPAWSSERINLAKHPDSSIHIFEGVNLINSLRTPLDENGKPLNTELRISMEHLGRSLELSLETADGSWKRKFRVALLHKDYVNLTLSCPPKVAKSEAFFVNVGIGNTQAGKDNRKGVFPLYLNRGARIDLELKMSGMEIVEEIRTQTWSKEATELRFPVRAPISFTTGRCAGTLLIAVDSFPIGKIGFDTRVMDSDSRLSLPAVQLGKARRFASFYPCFAAQDREKVLPKLKELRMAGIEIDPTLVEKDPKERWEQELYKSMIKDDAVLLFWSSNAGNDQWIVRECAYAIDIKGKDSIIPVIVNGASLDEAPSELLDVLSNENTPYLQ